MELAGDMVQLMLPNNSNSSSQELVAYVKSTLPKHEPWSLPSAYHNINGQGFHGHQIEGALHKGMMAIFFWLVFIIVTTSVEFWRQICYEKYFWQAHQHIANSLTFIDSC